MKLKAILVVSLSLIAFIISVKDKEIIKVRRTFYCASGGKCHEKICGGNKKTSYGRDASIADGCAVDRRRIPYGCLVSVKSGTYMADDTFSKDQRNRDWNRNIIHLDIRVAGRSHSEVKKMGDNQIQMQVVRKNGKIVKLIEIN